MGQTAPEPIAVEELSAIFTIAAEARREVRNLGRKAVGAKHEIVGKQTSVTKGLLIHTNGPFQECTASALHRNRR